MNKELKHMANKLMFDLNEEEMKDMDFLFTKMKGKIGELQKIDVAGIEPMARIIEEPVMLMRDDNVVTKGIKREYLLGNAGKVDNVYVEIEKVVKNEK